MQIYNNWLLPNNYLYNMAVSSNLPFSNYLLGSVHLLLSNHLLVSVHVILSNHLLVSVHLILSNHLLVSRHLLLSNYPLVYVYLILFNYLLFLITCLSQTQCWLSIQLLFLITTKFCSIITCHYCLHLCLPNNMQFILK